MNLLARRNPNHPRGEGTLSRRAFTGGSAVAGFSLTVPDTWFEIDLNPVTRRASIDALVRERTRGVPELEEHRTAIARLLRAVAGDAAAGGAMYCGVMAEAVEGVGLSASVTVSPLPVSRAGPAAGATLDWIRSTLSEKTARSQDDTWTTVALIDLPHAGPAVRSFGVEDVSLPDQAGWIRATVMQTFVPVPRSDRVILISCSSPNLVLVDAFHDLFDAVTSTFRFVDTAGTGAVSA